METSQHLLSFLATHSGSDRKENLNRSERLETSMHRKENDNGPIETNLKQRLRSIDYDNVFSNLLWMKKEIQTAKRLNE